MTVTKICSSLELYESLPINQQTSCYELVKAENIRHEVMIDHIGEWCLIIFITIVALVSISAIFNILKELFDY